MGWIDLGEFGKMGSHESTLRGKMEGVGKG